MGHVAFESATIFASLPLKIESLDGWGNNRFILGTSEGHLLVYDVEEIPGAASTDRFHAELRERRMKLSKKPIQQLNVIEELNIIIILSDGYVLVHTLQTLELKSKLSETRGASLYSIDFSNGKLLLCVAVKKKLVLFQWNHTTEAFVMSKELHTPEVAKAIAWCDQNLCVGFSKREYSLIHIATGECTELFGGGKNADPSITVIPNREMLLGKDNISVFLGFDGKPRRHHGISWSEAPITLGYYFPYVLGVVKSFVEVRTIETQALVQSIPIHGARLLNCKKDVYVASANNLYRLIPVSLLTQANELIEARQYKEALNLTERMTELDEKKKAEKIKHIKTLFAYDLFVKLEFEESMNRLYELRIDPPQVIGMFPDLLPEEHRNSNAFSYPIDIPYLEGAELEKGLGALIMLLTKVRTDLDNPQRSPGAYGSEGGPKVDELRQIIDTTLLKAYLKTNKVLVGSLLRIPNHCHVEECEGVLMKAQRWGDLVTLYKGKNLHRKSLELLTKLGQQGDGPLSGIGNTIWYLQSLGAEYMDLIVEFSKWILKENPEEGLTIFTEATGKVDSLPQDRVLSHLESVAPDLVVKYLEHIIFTKNSVVPEFHDKLVFDYLNSAKTALSALSTEETDRRAENPVRACDEKGELGEIRAKLLQFLETSQHYNPDRMLSRFPFVDLCEERAVLLSRIGRHEQALGIYAHKLGDAALAEAYCARHYDPEKEGEKDVYLSLLRVYLAPAPDWEPMTDLALDLLIKHHARISTAKALELLPPDVPIEALLPFFESVLEETSQTRRHNQIVKNLLRTENLQVRETLIKNRKRYVKITDSRNCPVCHKRIGANIVFACYPDDTVVHYNCQRESKGGHL